MTIADKRLYSAELNKFYGAVYKEDGKVDLIFSINGTFLGGIKVTNIIAILETNRRDVEYNFILDSLKKGKLSKLKYKLYDDMFELVDRYVMTNRKVVAQERVGDDYIYTDGYNFMFYTKNLKINSYGQLLENGKEIKVYTKTPLLHLKDRYAELRIYGFKSKYTVCKDIDKIQ